MATEPTSTINLLPEEEWSPALLFRTIWRRRTLVLGFALGGALLLTGYTLKNRAMYGSEARILVVPEQIGPMSGLLMGKASPLDIQIGIFESDSVGDETDSILGPDVDYSVAAKSDPDANQITVNCFAPTKDTALKACNASIDAFAKVSRRLSVSRTTTEADLLKDSVDRLRGELRDAENQMLAYQKTMKSVPSASVTDAVGNYMGRYQDLRTKLGDVEQKLDSLRSQAGRLAAEGTELPTGVPQLDKLRETFLGTDAELKQDEVVFGPEAPRVVALRERREIARRALESETKRYAASVVGKVNRDVADLEAQRQSLVWQLNDLRKVLPSVAKESTEVARLARHVGLLSDVLNQTEASYEQARVKAEADRVKWSVLDKPRLSNKGKPVNKNYLRYGLGGLILGGLLGSLVALVVSLRRGPISRI